MRVSVLISSRNRLEVLSRSLQSVLRQDYSDLEILVLDDASDEADLCRVLMDQFKDTRLRCLRSDVQLGVAKGRNKLMAEGSGEILCCIDDDAYFADSNAIARLVQVFRADRTVGIVACKVVEQQRPDRSEYRAPFSRRWRRRRPDITEQAQEVSYYLGTCHAIRREVVEVCGGYNDGLVFGEEELDLSYRVIDRGWKLWYEPTILVIHEPQPSVISKKRGAEIEHHVKNRLYLAWRYLPWKYVPVYLCVWLTRLFYEATKEGALAAYFHGLKLGLRTVRKTKRQPLSPLAIDYIKQRYGRLWY